ncbi:MAG: CRTAC1 family protein [Pirellulaceae bacterium]
MSQPTDMNCQIKAQGKIDHQAGEFWVENPFEMLSGKHNISAYESNRLLMNVPGKPFADLSHESGADIDSDSRSVIAADFDRDGDLDLLVASSGGGALRLFQNRMPQIHQRVQIVLAATSSNASAIGTRVVADVGSQRITRDVFAVNGFMAQSPAELILGVGDADTIDRLEVRWPTGKTDVLTDVPITKSITITEGSSAYDKVDSYHLGRQITTAESPATQESGKK